MTYSPEYDTEQILKELSSACAGSGGQEAFAKKAGVSHVYVSRVLKGWDKPGPSIFTQLGYRQKVVYEKVNPPPQQDHWSDCAVNNAPALPVGECNCGGFTQQAEDEAS